MSFHTVFVLDMYCQPLTPTTPARARKLLKASVAKPAWSKVNTFGIQMLVETRNHTPRTAIGYDAGTKFEGYSIVVETENPLNIMLLLPDKKKILRKVEERRTLRRARRFRKCRRRPMRSANRSRRDFLAPSQAVIVYSRLKILRELCRIFPVTVAGVEDVRFNHAAHRCGANFSTMEIGKARIQAFFDQHAINVSRYQGFETQTLRQEYGYRKSSDKSSERFEAHCSDALTLACVLTTGMYIEPGRFLTVDDTYRPVRRRLHDTQPAAGGVRAPYSRGTVFGIRKGLLIGANNGKVGQLCGEYRGRYRYYDSDGKRQSTKHLSWISTHVVTRERKSLQPPAGSLSSPA